MANQSKWIPVVLPESMLQDSNGLYIAVKRVPVELTENQNITKNGL